MLERMVDHMRWANGRMLDWMAEPGNATEELMRLAGHVIYVQRLWIRRIQGAEHERDTFRTRWPAELRVMAEENFRELRGLLASETQRAVEYRLMDGTRGSTRLAEIVMHAFSHGFHHLGQMAAMAGRSGRKFPDMSYLGMTRMEAAK